MAHFLTDATVSEIVKLRAGGAGLREISRVLGISKNTVSRYVNKDDGALCKCGAGAGHNGWCCYRVEKSPARKAYLAGETSIVGKPEQRSRIKEVTKEKRIWLGIDRFDGEPIPYRDHLKAVGRVERLTARVPIDIRDDVRQEMIVSCLEGRLLLEDVEKAVVTFIGFMRRGGVWRDDAGQTDYEVSNIFYSGSFRSAA